MTTVLQNQSVSGAGINGVPSWTFTLTSTGAGNLVVIEAAIEQFGGTGNITAFTITDNGSGNIWATTKFVSTAAGSGAKIAAIIRCLSISAGTTSVTITAFAATADFFGSLSLQEVSGAGTWSDDKSNSATAAGQASPFGVTNAAVDVGTTDFVAAAFSFDSNAAPPANISDPTGTYTTGAVCQDDNFSCGETNYRVNSSALTDSISWSWTTGTSPIVACAIASYKITAPTIVDEDAEWIMHQQAA